MAERKSGPVKPPVIDLTAKPATRAATAAPAAASPALEESAVTLDATEAPPPDAAAPTANSPAGEARFESAAAASDAVAAPAAATAPDSASDQPRPPPPPRPPARLAMPWSAISIAAVAGALLGTLLTYLAVSVLPLPDARPPVADPGPRLAAQEGAIADLTTRLAAVEASADAATASAADAAEQSATGLDALRQQLAELPVPPTVDLAPLQAQIAGLEDRIAAIGAGASGADATALADTISGLQSQVGEVRSALDALTERTAAAEQSIAALRDEVTAAATVPAPPAAPAPVAEATADPIAAAVRLPLLVSGVESAFAAGRPYAEELAGLGDLLPGLAVPDPIAAAAPNGLPRPDTVAAQFTDAVPAILAARPAGGSGDLGQDALEWAKGLLALRPMAETEGATPEAVVSRLEAAVGRRDYVAAAALLDQLPAPMQAAAGSVGTDIRTLATADGFVAALRAQALQSRPAEAAP